MSLPSATRHHFTVRQCVEKAEVSDRCNTNARRRALALLELQGSHALLPQTLCWRCDCRAVHRPSADLATQAVGAVAQQQEMATTASQSAYHHPGGAGLPTLDGIDWSWYGGLCCCGKHLQGPLGDLPLPHVYTAYQVEGAPNGEQR